MEQVASKGAAISRRIDGAIRFFLYILIFWLPYSPAVVESCVIISLLLWTAKRIVLQGEVWRQKELSFRQKIIQHLKGFRLEANCLSRPIAFFLFICVLSAASSHFFENAAHNLLTKTLEWFIVYFLVIEVFKERRHFAVAFGIWIFTAFSTVIDSFIQYYFTYKDIFSGSVIEPGGRATAGFKTSNGLGGYLSILIPFMLSSLFVSVKRVRYRLIGLFVFCVSLWSLLITFSRGAVLGVSFGMLFFVCVVFTEKRKAKYVALVLTLLIIGILGGYAFLVFGGHVDIGFLIRHETAQWRLNVWQDTLIMIKDRPLLGHGINTYMATFEAFRRDFGTNPTYAHNCYIQLAAEIGLLGLGGFVWIIASLLNNFFKNLSLGAPENKSFMILSVGLLSGIMSFLAHSFFDTNFYSLQLSVYLWVMIGMLVSLDRNILNPTSR